MQLFDDNKQLNQSHDFHRRYPTADHASIRNVNENTSQRRF
jgi:hypothetical protein